MQTLPGVQNEKFGYDHPLVGLLVGFARPHENYRFYYGLIVRVQETVGMDNQINIAIAYDGTEQYCPLDEIQVYN